MVKTEDFIKRLQKIIDYYGESASSFAEKIGVQPDAKEAILFAVLANEAIAGTSMLAGGNATKVPVSMGKISFP